MLNSDVFTPVELALNDDIFTSDEVVCDFNVNSLTELFPRVFVGPLSVLSVTLNDAAKSLISYTKTTQRLNAARPLVATSVNGHVLSLCSSRPDIRTMFSKADFLHCDGQPMVLLSRWLARQAFPTRVATTDLFPVAAKMAEAAGSTFYFLGGTAEINKKAVANVLKSFPALKIVGASHGFLSREEEQATVADIARLRPDVLWVGLGVPLELDFCWRNLEALRGVGVIKTAGGLFDFLSLHKPRAPLWMQRAGLEWLFRLMVDPKRLFLRYLVTNPHALFIMLTRMR